MEIAEQELDALVRDVDELHHAALGASPPSSAVGDVNFAAFAASVEKAFVALYAIGATKLSGAALRMATTFAAHHQDHANAFNVMAGAKALSKTAVKTVGKTANAKLLAVLAPRFTGAPSQTAVVELAFEMENSAAATYQHALDDLTGTETIQLAASIMPVESQHAVALGTLLGKDLKRDLIVVSFQTNAGWLDPGKYPVGA